MNHRREHFFTVDLLESDAQLQIVIVSSHLASDGPSSMFVEAQLVSRVSYIKLRESDHTQYYWGRNSIKQVLHYEKLQ